MPSVMGLLEERERAARQRVEALQAELREAEGVWERFVIACETVGEVLAEPRGGEDVMAGRGGRRTAGAGQAGGARWIRHPRAVREAPLSCPASHKITRPSRRPRTPAHQDR